MNTREVKRMNQILDRQFGVAVEGYVFLLTEKNKIYLLSSKDFDTERLKVMHAGMYFGEWREDGIRLSVDGSQLVGGRADKNVVELDDSQAEEWLRGEDMFMELDNGYYIIKNNNDLLGTGKFAGGKLLNYVPKARRVGV